MGYNVHVTRKKFWADEEGELITVQEWLALASTDPQLQLDPTCKRYSVAIIGKQHYAPCVYWFEGNLSTKNPNEEILGKMLEIASSLDARVQGEEGEIYRSASLQDFYYEA